MAGQQFRVCKKVGVQVKENKEAYLCKKYIRNVDVSGTFN